MKVLCVLAVLVATVWARNNLGHLAYRRSPLTGFKEKRWAPFGFLDKIKDSVNGMIDTGVNIKDKLAQLTNTVNEIIESLREVYEDYSDQEADIPTSKDELLMQILEKFHDDIVNALIIVFDQIDAVFHSVAGSVDGMLGNMWGTGVIKKGINQLLKTLYFAYTESVVEVLRMAIKRVDFIDIGCKWDEFVDHLMESIEVNLDAKLDAFEEKLKKQGKRELVSRSADDGYKGYYPLNTWGIIYQIRQ